MRCRAAPLRFFLWRGWTSFAGPRPLPFDLVHAFPYALFYTFIRGTVVDAVTQIVGQALHVRNFGIEVVGILISVTVAQSLHQLGRSVA